MRDRGRGGGRGRPVTSSSTFSAARSCLYASANRVGATRAAALVRAHTTRMAPLATFLGVRGRGRVRVHVKVLGLGFGLECYRGRVCTS